MSVIDYHIDCGYLNNHLKKVVYLVGESHLKRIHIDNGAAYIDGLSQTPYRIDVGTIEFNEESSLDERYAFEKTLTFRVNGRKNIDFLSERYYAIIENENGTKYMVNVEFPSKVAYTYTLSDEQDETLFTLSILSNHPTLRLATGFNTSTPCEGYFLGCVKSLRMIEKMKAALNINQGMVTTSEGLKSVSFLKNTFTFTENYDGNRVTDTISFGIPLWQYKSSWHYNLLEWIENKYSAIIEGCNGYNYVGFNFGLQPSFTIQGEGDNALITITLVESAENGGHFSDTAIPEDINSSTTYVYTDEHDGFVCVEGGMGQYTLQKELNFLGNPTGNYRALQGYEDLFPDLNIVGTFTDTVLFPTDKCGGEGGGDMTGGTLPDVIELESGQCKSFTFSSVCSWEIVESTSDLSITPTSGVANRLYNITVCKNAAPTCNVTLSDNISELCLWRTINNDNKYYYYGRRVINIVSDCIMHGESYHGHGQSSGGYGVIDEDYSSTIYDQSGVGQEAHLELTCSLYLENQNYDEYFSTPHTVDYLIKDENDNTIRTITVTLNADCPNSGGGVGGSE